MAEVVPAELRGSGPALLGADGAALSYAALRDRVGRLAATLPRERIVAVCAPRPIDYLIGALAAFEAGAVLLPVDLRLPVARREALLAELGAAVLILGEEASPLEGSRVIQGGLVLCTSGSSGSPKRVLLGREGLRANVEAILDYLPVGEHPRTGIVLPLSYSYALVGQALTTLHAGGTVVLLSDGSVAAQAAALSALRVQGLSSVPASLRMLAAIGLPKTLRYAASAGAPLPRSVYESVARPGLRFFNQYGLTEASPRVTAISDEEQAFHAGSVGRPLRGVEVEIVEGEVVVRSPSVMVEYLDDPEGTARVLGAKGLHSGDLGRLEGGCLYVSGRVDDLVKIAGERVGLEEVAASLRALSGVAAAAVVTQPDPRTELRLVAGVVLEPGVSLREVRRALRGLHPARRPKLVELRALPVNARGKLDRAALAEALEAAKPGA